MSEQVSNSTSSLKNIILARLGLSQFGTTERKTVTFGDASAVTAGRFWSILAVVVVIVLWIFSSVFSWTEPIFLPSLGAIGARFVEITCWQGIVPFLRELGSMFWALMITFGQVLYRLVTFQFEGIFEFKNTSLFWEGGECSGYARSTFFQHLGASIYRIIVGFVLGCFVGIPLGLSMGLSRILRGIFDPIVEFFRPIPPLAFIPLVIIWFGIREQSKVILLFFAALWIMVIAARSGVLSVKLSKVHAAYSLGASKWQVLRHVILPNALPEIFTGMRVSLGICWGTLVAAELVGAQEGIGQMIWIAQKFLLTDVVFIGIIVIGIVGFTMDIFMRFLEGQLIPWRGKG